MSISSNLISAIDSLIYAFRKGTKMSLKDYSDLETILNPTTLVAKDGSMATIYEIYGSKKFIGEEEILLLEERLYGTLKTGLQKEGQQLQFVFVRDKDRIKEHITQTLEPYRKAAKNLQLELDDMFTSKVDHLANFCSYEAGYMVVWSKPELIRESLKQQQEENAERAKKAPLFVDAQNIIMEYDRLETAHSAICSTIEKAFKKAEINIAKLNVRKALKEVRNAISYENTAEDWEPSLPLQIDEDRDIEITLPMNDKRRFRQGEEDVSSLLWSSISEQIFPTSVEVVDNNVIKMGSKYISSLYMDIPPQNVMSFSSLLDSVDPDIPLQISFTLESGGLNKEKMRAMAASILAVTNSGNKMVRDSINYLRELELEGESIVRFSVNMMTWSEDTKELNVRKQTLNKKLQSWGNCNIAFTNIDPIEGVLLTVPAVTKKSSSATSLAPLLDIIKMLPLTRQSHVWKEGSVLFRTYDGKLFPFQPGSSLQNTWNDLIFATPGSGKSVLMNAMNLASIIQPGASELPYIGILDIGPSSMGLIQLLRDALPERLKHLVLYERIQNTHDYAINIFDTLLGSRQPTPSHKQFLQNIITLIMTPAGEQKPPSSPEAMVSKIVKAAYERFEDTETSSPKKYSTGIDFEVDKKLSELGLKDADERKLSWWKIVDFLFDKGEKRLAAKAQRYAVPVLEDLIDVARSTNSINSMYSKPEAETSESMIDLFNRLITEAIEQFPMLSIPTVFDLSEARVISLDLDEVTKGDDAASAKQNAIMFMLGRYIVGKNFKISVDEIKNSVNKRYMKHHLPIAKKNREVKKRLCIDEFHRTHGIQAIRNQVKTDQREGRKWNLQVTLSSQMLADFGDDMRELSSGIFIMSGGAELSNSLAKKFSLNQTTKDIVKYRLNGPTSEGAPFVFNCSTKTGSYSQFLYSTLSPIEIWSLTTTAEDAALRDRLTEELGSSMEARRILASAFKGGSAKSRIEKIATTSTSIEATKDPYGYLIEKLKKKYNVF
jgi:intracellular multiplication protein IcmB